MKLSFRNKTIKRSVFFVIIGVLVGFTVVFAIFYFVSRWYDAHRVSFQRPVIVKLQPPVLISKRLIESPLPKATYIEVSPLMTPGQVDKTVKEHGSFGEFISSASLESVSRETVKTLIHNKVIQKFGESAWRDIDYIITHESNYDPYIVNKESGACGIFQALPCSKLPSLDVTDQITWGMNYIEKRYGSAKSAYEFKLANGWY